jgi:hypothetical protein
MSIILFGSEKSIFINDIRYHGLSYFFYLTVCSSQYNDTKIKNLKTEVSRITNSLSSIFIYKKRDREIERKKKEIRETEKIKIKNRPFQLQTIIIFDRKLQLRCAKQPRKVYDDIYKINYVCYYDYFRGQNISSSSSKTHLKFI